MDIVAWLNYLGLTRDRIAPFLLLIAAIIWIVYKFTHPVKKSVTRITNACIEIQTVIENSGVVLRHHLVESPGSPVAPTDYGKQLIHDSGLEKILDDQTSFLKEELKKKLPEKYTEYDVQEKARELLAELKENEMMNPVKKYAYDNGLNADLILRVGGLWLRDDFMGKKRQVNSTDKEKELK